MTRAVRPIRASVFALIGLFALFALGSCTTIEFNSGVIDPPAIRVCEIGDRSPNCPPNAPREFRAVWVATVANIDWPTKPGLTSDQQRAEAVAILNRVQALNMNAVLLQVRPGADAIYPSSLEPWAEWLTGEQGKSPGYDPLQFWIDEARKRGIEVHAWFNPYRARHTKAVSNVSTNHVAKRIPNAVKSYGGFLWLDPGERAAQEHSFAVIMDVLRRYDIDGVHFDDYFYPYPVTETSAVPSATFPQSTVPNSAVNSVANALNQSTSQSPANVVSRLEREIEFPDEPSWQAYIATGGKLNRADWRRDNVNRFVERVYRGVKAEKPWVRFGISPFGIGRPDRRPPAIVGFSQYDKLYADVELWLQRGWMDYLAPQLYWPIGQTPQAFPVLLDYWHSQNTSKRDIFPGLYTSRIDETSRSWEAKEIENQIALIRAKSDVPQGHIHFSVAPLMQNRRNMASALAQGYSLPAINTESIRNTGDITKRRAIDIHANPLQESNFYGIKLQAMAAIKSSEVRGLSVHLRYGDRWQFAFLPVATNAPRVEIETTVARATADGELTAISAAVVDRYSHESERYVREVSR